MRVNRVSVLGGSGFVGQHVVHELVRRDYEVSVLTRDRERAKSLILLPKVQVVTCNVHDQSDLRRHIAGSDALINLVGILHDTRKARFSQVHVDLARRVIEACKTERISRLIHMSALQADPQGPSAYLRSKGEAQRLVQDFGSEATTRVTIFRPSVIFGPGDSFLTLFAKLVKALPVIALASPRARFQPIYVEDVARAIVESLDRPETFGGRYDLCGPKVYALEDLVRFVAALLGKRRPIIGLGDRLSYLQAWAMEFSPIKLMTRDNYYSMKVDSVCNCDFPEVFGFKPTTLESVAVDYLTGGSLRSRYRLFRYRAGR